MSFMGILAGAGEAEATTAAASAGRSAEFAKGQISGGLSKEKTQKAPEPTLGAILESTR